MHVRNDLPHAPVHPTHRHRNAAAAHSIAGTSLSYHDDDIDRGRLSLILTPPPAQDLETFSHTCTGVAGAHVTDRIDLVNGLVVEVPLKQASAFVKGLPAASQAWIDSTIHFGDAADGADAQAATSTHRANRNHSPASSATSHTPSAKRSTRDRVGVDPAAPSGLDIDRDAMHLDRAWAQGVTGKNVTVAVIDSGFYPHADLKDKLVEFKDFSDDHLTIGDRNGHGTHMASLIAGSGARSKGLLKGAAPDARLVGVRITTVSEAIAGLAWVVQNKDRLGIKVVNMSLGTNATVTASMDPWVQAVDKAVAAGLTVVVAAGDEGENGWQGGSISSPGTAPDAITVGAMDTHKTLDPSDDTIWSGSSRGPTFPDQFEKPDLVAPGADVYGALVPNSFKDDPSAPHLGRDYVALPGSSDSTGFVSGIVALMLQANPNLKPDDVKTILKQTTQKTLHEPSTMQGAGMVDASAAVAEALRRRLT